MLSYCTVEPNTLELLKALMSRIHLKFIPEQMNSAIMRVRHMRPTEF